MKLNKSPGSDGLTVEFYRKFWPKIGDFLVNSLNHSYEKGELSSSQKHSILSLIYKKGDPNNIENWRPISLLNIDYKIATRCLSKRLQKVLPDLISMDQQGYIKNRNICFNIRQIQDIIDYADLFEIDGVILFLDFKKAFDTVEHEFMLKTLQQFGFGDSFIKWIKTLYNNITSCIFNNGWRSKTIHPSRGLKQGCSLSALVYILVAEILAIKLRKSEEFQGICLEKIDKPDTYIKLTQLADDTTIFCQNKNDAKNALKLVENFGSFSGLKLNRLKTECLWIGNTKHSKENIDDIKFSKQVKALGIIFGHDDETCSLKNWEKPLDACRTIIKSWSKRNITFYGRVTIIKTMLLSKFIYLFQSLKVPDKIIDEINKMFFSFFMEWQTRKKKKKNFDWKKRAG